MKHLASQPELEALPAPFPAVIRKALAKNPTERFASVSDMVGAVFGEPAIEASVAGFDAVSLRDLAAEVERKGIRVGAAPEDTLPVPPLAHAPAPQQPAPPARESEAHAMMTFVLAVGVLVVSCLLIAKDQTMFGVGLLVVGWVYVYEMRDRSRKVGTGAGASAVAGSGIVFPIQRSFVTGRRQNLSDILNRYFVSLGYTPSKVKDSLLWAFSAGEWDEYTVRVAAYEVPDGYHLTCTVNVEDPDEVTSEARLQMTREIEGLEQLFKGLDESGAGGTRAAEAQSMAPVG
jgi:hypothetical protein